LICTAYSAAVASPWTEFRFVEGRPVGDVTVQFLAWACDQLRAEEKTRLLVVWDVASWHAGRPVSDWIAEHAGRRSGTGGVQIVLCPLPVKSPWLVCRFDTR